MPKVMIEDRYMGSDSDEVAQGSEFALRVGWSKEAGDVQVATVALDDRRVLEPTPEGNGWFVTLDRSGINKTIRALRAARDAAFGRDE